jgi:hypothetical protein
MGTAFFYITGEFVTKTARDWLYTENRPYEKVIDFLLLAMDGTDLGNETLTRYANDILTGKKKIIGDTRDNSYCMVDDDTDIIKEYQYYFKNKLSEKFVIEGRNDEDSGLSDIALNLMAYKSLIKDRIIKNTITTSDYGWLRPDGKFFEVEWGGHESWAIQYVEKHYPNRNIYYAGDFLKEHNWLLLHSPGQGNIDIPVDDIQSSTKKQKEFLYDYFLERGRNIDANIIWQGEV